MARARTRKTEPRLALALSGGGFRAACFHLGALTRLNELGLLPRIAAVSAVSGGGILLHHLIGRLGAWWAQHAGRSATFDAWEDEVLAPFRSLVRRGLRNRVLWRALLDAASGAWSRPTWGPRFSRTRALADLLAADLGDSPLRDLPADPWFGFCATSLRHGNLWLFSRDAVGEYVEGTRQPAPGLTCSMAAAVSAAFPPVFEPAEIRNSGPLSDGGLYDNLGLEPVWRSGLPLFVSDGGQPFEVAPRRMGRSARYLRYIEILQRQSAALRKRALFGSGRGNRPILYWSLDGGAGNHTDIRRIRTDLNRFSEGELAALENHGYARAHATLQKHGRGLALPRRRAAVPWPDYLDEDRLRAVLAESHRSRLFA